MKFEVNKAALLKQLSVVIGAVEKRSTIPILTNLLIEAQADGLTIKATDLDLSITTHCAAEVSVEGRACINAGKLLEIVKALPDAVISLVLDGEQVKLKCERSRFKLQSVHPDQYPAMEIFNGPFVALPAQTMARFINRTQFAISHEESRYALNGVKFEVSPTTLKMIATDGHRLSYVETTGAFGESAVADVIIPRKALTELAKLCAGVNETLNFGLTENHLFFQVGDRLLVSRRIAGQFPNYELVLPQDNHNNLQLNREQVGSAIRRVALMADERSRAIKFDLAPGHVHLSSQAADAGDAREEIEVNYDGDAITAGFNANYLQDCFGVMPGEEVSFLFKDGLSQMEIQPVSDETDLFRYVIMPMRL